MPVDEILDEGVDDAEEVLIAWLKPLRPLATGNTRRSGAPLPYTLVTHLMGNESIEESNADPIVSVQTLCDKNLGQSAFKVESQRTHRRMMLLARYNEDVVLDDGRIASIDYVQVTEMPRTEPYGDDQILRKIGRYQLGLSYA